MELTHSEGAKSFRTLCFMMQESGATVKHLSDNLKSSRGKITFLIRSGIKIFTFHKEMATLPPSHLKIKVDGFLSTCSKVLASRL